MGVSTEDPRPMTAPPEGWYPGPDGTKRYWDGVKLRREC